MTKDDAKKFGIEERRRKFFFRAFSGKLNFAPPIDESDWFEIKSVDLDNGFEDGDAVGVVTRWSPPTAAAAADLSLDKVTEIRLAVGTEKRWKEHQLAGMWVGKAIAPVTFVVATTGVKMTRHKASARVHDGTRATRFRSLVTLMGGDELPAPPRRRPFLLRLNDDDGQRHEDHRPQLQARSATEAAGHS